MNHTEKETRTMTNTEANHGPRPLTVDELKKVQGGLCYSKATWGFQAEPQPSGFLQMTREAIETEPQPSGFLQVTREA